MHKPGAPLSGITVVDWTHVLAGPACAYFLGLLGADVIKVESPARGDAMRHRGGTDKARAAAGMSTAYLTQGGGKSSFALDLAKPEGREVFARLLARADVLVENHRPSTLQRLSLTEKDSRAINPRLIHCAMTGYGRGNQMSDAPAYDVNIQAISGLMTLTGTAETGPLRTGAPIIDYATALSASFAITAALVDRARTGKGAFVDVSMLETAFALMGSSITDYRLTGTPPRPRGNAANSRSPAAGTFPCRTGHISLGVNEEAQFTALARAVRRSDWLTDPRFATPAERDRHRHVLAEDLQAALSQRSASEWEAIFWQEGVPSAKLRTLPEALELPCAAQPASDGGQAAGVNLPFKIDGARRRAGSAPPRLGENSISVMQWLGYSSQEIRRLSDAGIVGLSKETTDG